MEDLKDKKKLAEKKTKNAKKKIITTSSSNEVPKRRGPARKKPIMDRPKYLSWKVFDNFDNVKEDKLFLDGILPKPLNLLQRTVAKRECDKVAEEFNKDYEKMHEKQTGRSENLKIAGGNFTHSFIIPKSAIWIKKHFPHQKFQFELFEADDLESLEAQDADIIMTGNYPGGPNFTDKQLDTVGYKRLRFSCKDKMYWAASQESIDKFGSKEAVLQKHDVIFSRRYTKYHIDDYNKELERPYPIVPKGRTGLPRIVVDQYLTEQMMARDGLGIATIYESMGDSHGLIRLDDEPIVTFERYVIVKKTLDRKYHAIARRLIYILRHKGK